MTIRGGLQKHRAPAGPWIGRHAVLSPAMREGLDNIVLELLNKTELRGLCILVEAVVAGVIPGYQRQYPGNALHEGAGLVGSMLHEDQGISPEHVASGREWLGDIEKHTPNALLTMYLRLRKEADQTRLALARARQGIQ
jgi:hypothetical protein